MRGARWLVLASCSMAMMFASSVAKAGGGGTIDGGTISFIGAVVEPTCSVAGTPADLNRIVSAAQAHPALSRSCSATAMAAGVESSGYRPYAVNVVHLSGAQADRVLSYFAGYVRAAQPASADPVLVTQTYD